MFDCSLRSRGSRFEAAAFTHSQTESVSARSFVQDSGARSWARWNPLLPSLAEEERGSSRRPNQDDTNLLPGNRLGGPIDVTINDDGDDWISAGDRMVGKKEHRLAASRNLDRASHDALAGQFLSLFRNVVLQRLTLKTHPDAVAATGGSPRCRGKCTEVVEPVISRAAQHVQEEWLTRQRRRRSLVNAGEVGWWRPHRQDVAGPDRFGS
jgi:hypothetical protein